MRRQPIFAAADLVFRANWGKLPEAF